MKSKEILGFLSAGLCIAFILTAGMLANGAAQSYNYPYSNIALQTPQEREELFKAFQSIDRNNTTQSAPIIGYPYAALQNPYSYKDPQAELEQANAYKLIQKMNGAYLNSNSEDNWNYWANMWLNSQQGGAYPYPYTALQNPYSYKAPQSALDQADAYKMIQKMNGAYLNSNSVDNWNYWANMWLTGA